MFRVGDRIRVVRYADMENHPFIGEEGVISKIEFERTFPFFVDICGSTGMFLEEELEHSKEYKVLQILRQWQRSR